MYYNFTDENLRSEQRIEEYKAFSKKVLTNINGVQVAAEKLKEFDENASMVARIDGLDYKSYSRGICVTGDIYPADRLRQSIYASQRDNNLVVNVQYQEGTGSKDDPFIDVANIAFQYSPDTEEINIGEVLDTQTLVDMYKDIKTTNKDDTSEHEGR